MVEFQLLIHGDVWDANHGMRSNHWIGIRNGMIAAVSTDRPGTADTEVNVNMVTPGLCDMHVHLVWDGSGDPVATLRSESMQEITLRAVHNARKQLHGGVTTIRDVGSVDDIAVTVSRAIRDGWVKGPRTYASGRTIIISGGHDPFWGIESDGPQACRRSVRRLRSAGAHLIKVSATGGVYGQAIGEDPGASELSLVELEAIVDEASRFDMPVAAHAVGREGITNAIEAGIDTIEHGNTLNDELINRLVNADCAYDPTLFVYARISEGGNGIPEYARRNAERVYGQHVDAFQTALNRDCRILSGSDAGSPNVPHPSLNLELTQMVREGMAPEAALESATITAAKELGRPELGIIAPDTLADLVCFDDDPLANIEATADPSHVVKEGKLLTR